MHLLFRWLLNTLALFIVVTLVPGFYYRSVWTLALAALVLGLLNAIVRPVLFVLTFPLTVVTLGLFLLVINGLLLWLVTAIVPGFHVNGFWGAVAGSILISIVSGILTRMVPST